MRWEGKEINEKGYDEKTKKLLVDVNPAYFRPAEVELLVGDSSKAERKLGWKPKVNIEKMVELMVNHDLKLVEEKLHPYTTEPDPFYNNLNYL